MTFRKVCVLLCKAWARQNQQKSNQAYGYLGHFQNLEIAEKYLENSHSKK